MSRPGDIPLPTPAPGREHPERPAPGGDQALLRFIQIVLLLGPLLLGAIWYGEKQAAAQRDRYGKALVSRLAAEAGKPFLAGDQIALSVLAREFTTLAGVTTAALYGSDNRLMVAADNSAVSPTEFTDHTSTRVFVAEIPFQDTLYGYARIVLDRDAFTPHRMPLIAIALLLGLLAQGATWSRLEPVWKHLVRFIAILANRRTAAMTRLPIIEVEDQEPPPRDSGDFPYLIVVNLFNQATLSAAERGAVIDLCEEHLDRVCHLHGGRHERLPGTGLAVVLDTFANKGDRTFQAICVALLTARVLAGLPLAQQHTGRPLLTLRIGMEQVFDEQAGLTLATHRVAEACRETLPRAVTLSAHARDKVIAVSSGVRLRCARPARLVTEPLSSATLRAAGEESAWLVHDLTEDYRSLLDSQARLLLETSVDHHPIA